MLSRRAWTPKNLRRPALWAATSLARNNPRNRHERTSTGRIKSGLYANQALAKVRPSEGFPNPILRLGKDASNYAQLLKKSAIERLQVNQRVVRQKRPEREVA